MAQARGAADSVAARAAQLERQAALLTEAAEAVRVAEDTAQRLKDADARLSDAAFRAGFDTPGRGRRALDDTAHRDLQRRLDAWQLEDSAVRAVLAEADTAAAAERPPRTWQPPNEPPSPPPDGCGRPPPPRTRPPDAARNWTGCPRARARPYAARAAA